MLLEYPNLQIQERLINSKYGNFVYIEASGTKRQDFIRPNNIIRDVFKASNIPLDIL